ncbi:hypothetical protein ACS0TY_022958 [Phlomoides rotata]
MIKKNTCLYELSLSCCFKCMLHSLARSRDVCSKPKSPRAHHCRSCGMCILDMDHHCPFVSLEYFSLRGKKVLCIKCNLSSVQ